MNKIITLILIFIGVVYTGVAQKSKDGAKTISGTEVVNEYTNLTVDASAGDLTLNVTNSSLNSNARFSSGLAIGDLLFVIQIQGVTINDAFRKAFSWGEILDYNNCGLSEYVEVANVPNGTSIELNCPLQNNYTSAGKVVVVRVPRYSTLNVPAGNELSGTAWDGTIGGLVVVEVEGDITVDGSVSMSEKGFRGTPSNGDLGSVAGAWGEFATSDGAAAALKGEGVAGYHTEYDGLKGRFGQGAAANGGGGGCAVDAGGGGGANVGDIALYTGKGVPDITSNVNYIQAWEQEAVGFSTSSSSGGGRGGYSKSQDFVNPYTNPLNDYGLWGSDGRRDNATGYGGRPLDYTSGRLFLGGGGGQGQGTNQGKSAGGSGGGMILLTSDGNINGAGKIVSRGQEGEGNWSTSVFSFNSDGAGGAGAGGTIVINAVGTITVDSVVAVGGKGGSITDNSWQNGLNVGPGGGGGGGYILLSSAGPNVDVSGGANGIMSSSTMDGVFEPNGATIGGEGQFNIQSASIPLLVANNDTVCSGETANLSVTATNLNGATITWYDAYSGGNIIGTGTTFSISNLLADSTVYAGVCPGITKVAVLAKVNSSLNGDVIADTVYACSGSSARMEASGGNTYLWYPSADLDANNQSVANITSTSSQTIYVDISLNGACVYTDSVFVSITPNLTVDLGDDKTICTGESVTLNASGGVNYTWTPNTAISSTSTPDVDVNPISTTKYYVTVDDGAGCSGEDSITVNIIPELEITVPAFQDLCKGELVNLVASHTGGSGGSVTYLWDEGVYTGANQTLSWAQNGSMEVKVVDDVYGCQDSASFPIQVRTFSVDFTYSDTCLGDQTSLNSLASTSGTIALSEWTINNNYTVNGTSVTYQLPNVGANTVTHVITDDIGCKDSIIKTIITKQPPVATVNLAPDTVCVGYDVLFTNAYLGVNGFDLDWDFGNGTTSTQDSGRYSYGVAGAYYIDFSVIDTNGCSASTSDSIFVVDGPVAGFTLPESVKLGEDITPVNTTTNGQVYYWSSEGDSLSDDYSPVFVADKIGAVCFELEVLSQAGCTDSYDACTEVEGEALLIPNVFTPNGDGINDYLTLINAEGKKFKIEVFNRWGILVYESPNDYQGDWAGLGLNGEALAEGTYFIIAHDLSQADSKSSNGFVYLTK